MGDGYDRRVCDRCNGERRVWVTLRRSLVRWCRTRVSKPCPDCKREHRAAAVVVPAAACCPSYCDPTTHL